jgi:hypothetical protein
MKGVIWTVIYGVQWIRATEALVRKESKRRDQSEILTRAVEMLRMTFLIDRRILQEWKNTNKKRMPRFWKLRKT